MEPNKAAPDNGQTDEAPDPVEEEPTQVAGYDVKDLLAAPLKPPEPVKTEGRHATQNSSVLFLMTLGVILFILGIVLILTFSTLFGLIIALLGGIAVAIAVFFPFHH